MDNLAFFKDNDLETGPQPKSMPSDIETSNIVARQKADDEPKRTEEELKDRQQDRAQRKEFANKIYNVVVIWLFFIGVIIFLCAGRSYAPCSQCILFDLPENVLISLIAGASINIIGLMAIVIGYLFPSGKKKI